jgi:hypothetical protein
MRWLPRSVLMPVIQEGTPGKWSLLATHPKRLGAVVELYATTGAAEGRAAVLRLSGHTVEVMLSKRRIGD